MPFALRRAARAVRPLGAQIARPSGAAGQRTFVGGRIAWETGAPATSFRSRPTRTLGALGALRCYTVKTPAFGAESITEGTVLEWNVKVGSTVKVGDILATIETDKVTVEVVSEQAGVVSEILAKPDTTVGVGQPLCSLKPGGAAAPAAAKAAPAAAKPAAEAAAAKPVGGATVEVKTPAFGAESITEGTVMEWRVAVGDAVRKGDILAVIETDKVSVEVSAQDSGIIKAIVAKEDTTVAVGQPLCTITTGGGAAASPAPAVAPQAAAPAAAASAAGKTLNVLTPEFGAESITEGTLLEINAKVGDFVKKGTVVMIIETDKVSVEVVAQEGGTISALHAQADATVAVGQPLFDLAVGGAAPAAAAADAPPAAAAAAPVQAAPQATKPAPAAKPSAPAGEGEDHRQERRVKLPRMRQAIARNLKSAQNTAATLTCFQEIDMSAAIAMRKLYKDQFEKAHGVKLGFMSIFLKASANALRQVPSVNAMIDDKAEEIVYREFVDIAFAAASTKGLVTPVMLDVHKKSIKQVEASFAQLAGKAKADKLTLDEMTGGSFLISNGGVFGSMMGTPMLGSTSMSAVLGLHATKMRAVALPSGEVVARPVMYVALTYDHRLVDSREAVTFLNVVRDQVEDPRRLLVEL